MDLTKARGDRARIEELLARESARVRRAFRQFLDDVRSEDARRKLRRVLETRGVEEALRFVDSFVVRMGGVLATTFQVSGSFEASALMIQLPRTAGVAISFDPTHPRAIQLMRRNRLEFVQGFTRGQRDATRAALTEALRSGAGPVQVARAFRNSIGLTEAQRRAVINYRRLLEMGDKEALYRDLRDRRFDASILHAVEDGVPLGAKRIDRMVDQYRNRALQSRAETIARTETLRTLSYARQEALAQTLEQVGMPKSSVVRIWRATQDDRTRDTHAEMDGQERGLEEAFQSSSGALLMYPGDPSAPASEIIQCRCTVLHEFRDV